MSRFLRAEIVNNLPLNNKSNLLTIKPLEPAIEPDPGQFYMIQVSNSKDPLLSRPFSFFRKTPDGIQFFFEVRGKGTLMMKGFKGGEVIHLLGPLGRGYPELEGDKLPLLVAGGIGIASIFPLAQAFGKKASLFYGARDKEGLLMLDELKGLVGELIISTDDGSMGYKGTVVGAFNDFLASHPSLVTRYLLYACGRKQMLEVLTRTALNYGIKGYVSTEENMACGVGACLGCAIKVKRPPFNSPSTSHDLSKGGYRGVDEGRGGIINSELRTLASGESPPHPGGFAEEKRRPNSELMYKMVCKDGPVFPLEEIVW